MEQAPFAFALIKEPKCLLEVAPDLILNVFVKPPRSFNPLRLFQSLLLNHVLHRHRLYKISLSTV